MDRRRVDRWFPASQVMRGGYGLIGDIIADGVAFRAQVRCRMIGRIC